MDQAKTILTLIDVLQNKSQKSIVSLTAARGRGKSAALGLSIAGAVKLGLTNLFVSSPNPENLNTFF